MKAAMGRRDWLKLFSTGVVGALVLDPEKLLWVPGEKTIFLPPVGVGKIEPAIYSLWQLGIRTVDYDAPNPFSTRGILGPRFEAEWQEVFRTNSGVQLQEAIDARRGDGRRYFYNDTALK